MAEQARFFDSVASDRIFTSADMAAVMDALLVGEAGVVRGYLNSLLVTATGGAGLSVASGAAFVAGREYTNTAAKSLTSATNGAGSSRIDLVVVKLDLSARTIATVIHQGVAGAGQPAPTVTGTVIELQLAHYTVTAGNANVTALVDDRHLFSVGGGGQPLGSMTMWPSTAAPVDWLLCDGTAIARATYAELFAIVGTQYGAGNGTTTFNLPNMKGRVGVGRDAAQTEFDVMGEAGGEKTHLLIVSEMPTHDHSPGTYQTSAAGLHVHSIYGAQNLVAGTNQGGFQGGSGNNFLGPTAPSGFEDGGHSHNIAGNSGPIGSSVPHNVLQPYVVVNYIIRVVP